MKALATFTTCMTATERQLAASSRPTHEVSRLTEWDTRFALPSQSERIQPKDTHPSPDFGGLLNIHCYHTETYCQYKGATKHGAGVCVGGGGLTQTSSIDIEGLGYKPPNRFITSLASLIPQPICIKPRHDAHGPNDDPRNHGFSLRSTPTRCPPTLTSKERHSSTHAQTCNPATHTPLGTVNPRMQGTTCSSQEISASID